MLSIKHVLSNGYESIISAVKVDKTATTPVIVYVTTPDGKLETFEIGRIYVVNETGKTIAKYDLNDFVPSNLSNESTT